jgi:signal transduction histidine kinase
VGIGVGGATACAELIFVLCTGPALAVPAARPAVYAWAQWLVELERRRLAGYFGGTVPGGTPGPRAWRYLAVRLVVGGLGEGVLMFIALGATSGGVMAWQFVSGQPLGGGPGSGDWQERIVFVLVGVLLIFLAVQGLIGVVAVERAVAARFLGPDGREVLRRRVSELAVSRAEVVEAVNDERRRIERDLHDGVQQRLVALGMLLGRARRSTDRERGDDLLRQAHEESQRVLADLRDVTWRVYPTALDEAGLHTALEALAERSGVPVRLRCELTGRVAAAVETAAYFVVSEAVTNAIKHSGATGIGIDVEQSGETVVVRVVDDGSGGADPAGGGLSGLARRVAAADGLFVVDSPRGGPTTVLAELPCG